MSPSSDFGSTDASAEAAAEAGADAAAADGAAADGAAAEGAVDPPPPAVEHAAATMTTPPSSALSLESLCMVSSMSLVRASSSPARKPTLSHRSAPSETDAAVPGPCRFGRRKVLLAEFVQLLACDGPIGERAGRHVRVRLLENRPCISGVPEVADVGRDDEQVAEPLGHAAAESDLSRRRHPLEHFDQLGGRVVRKIDVVREATAEPRVRIDESLHLLGIAGGDHGEV